MNKPPIHVRIPFAQGDRTREARQRLLLEAKGRLAIGRPAPLYFDQECTDKIGFVNATEASEGDPFVYADCRINADVTLPEGFDPKAPLGFVIGAKTLGPGLGFSRDYQYLIGFFLERG